MDDLNDDVMPIVDDEEMDEEAVDGAMPDDEMVGDEDEAM